MKGNHLKLVKPAQDEDNPDLNKERALLAREQREGYSIKNALARGEVIPAPEAVEGWQSAIARTKSLLLGLPVALAEELVLLAAQGPVAVSERLAGAIHSALQELANTSVDDVEEEAA